ncbi:MAG: ABC transporter ATP-binding protein [Vulcanimicrobiota bacterium]
MFPLDKLSVDVQKLSKKFGDFTAVDNVSFKIRRGSIFGFLGPNGAGKSTTIRMLLGIIQPTGGEGTVLGYDIFTQAEEIRANVGYMSQKFSLYKDLSVTENLNFFAGIFGLSQEARKDRIKELIKLTHLEGLENQLASGLPRGIQQRLAFAVALLHDPELVFLDEPTGGVDPALRRYFWEIIIELSQRGKTIMVTTHYMDEVERCDQICFIYGGRLIARGSPHELKTRFLDGQTYKLHTEERLEVMDVLKDFPGISNIFPAGETVRFLLKPDRSSPEQIDAEIGKKDIVSSPAKPDSPTLEDVFASLVEKQKQEPVS